MLAETENIMGDCVGKFISSDSGYWKVHFVWWLGRWVDSEAKSTSFVCLLGRLTVWGSMVLLLNSVHLFVLKRTFHAFLVSRSLIRSFSVGAHRVISSGAGPPTPPPMSWLVEGDILAMIGLAPVLGPRRPGEPFCSSK